MRPNITLSIRTSETPLACTATRSVFEVLKREAATLRLGLGGSHIHRLRPNDGCITPIDAAERARSATGRADLRDAQMIVCSIWSPTGPPDVDPWRGKMAYQ